MISLEKTSGLPIQIQDDYLLVFDHGLPAVEPQIRDFFSMKNYLKDPSSAFRRREVYYMYRGVGMPDHKQALQAANLRYDITVIPPGVIGREFVKTIGHYHSKKPGTNVQYPEVYEVIYGKVFWLLQSASDDFERLGEVILVAAGKGDKIIVPPGYGHVSINPGEDALVMSNCQALDNQAIYEPYEIHNGGAYYVLPSEHLTVTGKTSKEYEFSPNLTYKQVPPLSPVKPRELPQYDLRNALPMYFTVTKNLSSVEFLTSPEKYIDELTPDKLFIFGK